MTTLWFSLPLWPHPIQASDYIIQLYRRIFYQTILIAVFRARIQGRVPFGFWKLWICSLKTLYFNTVCVTHHTNRSRLLRRLLVHGIPSYKYKTRILRYAHTYFICINNNIVVAVHIFGPYGIHAIIIILCTCSQRVYGVLKYYFRPFEFFGYNFTYVFNRYSEHQKLWFSIYCNSLFSSRSQPTILLLTLRWLYTLFRYIQILIKQ